VVKKLVRRFNERFLGVVYYEMVVRTYGGFDNHPKTWVGEVFENGHPTGMIATGLSLKELKIRMSVIIAVFEGTPIDKIKFIKKYV